MGLTAKTEKNVRNSENDKPDKLFRKSAYGFDRSEKLKKNIGYHASQSEETERTNKQTNTANCDSAATPNSTTQTVKQKHTRTDIGLRSRI